jgi:hypothetical protein
MSLSVKDSGNNITALKSTIVGGEHITHHNIDSSALPTGAASAANQAQILSALLAQATKLDTQPVGLVTDSVGIAKDSTLAAAAVTLASILTAVGLQAKLADTQPVSIAAGFPVGLGLDATLQSILTQLVYPINTFTAKYAQTTADIVDQTPTVLVSGVPAAKIRVHSVGIGNQKLQYGSGGASVGTWVKIVKQANNATVLRNYYAEPGSFKYLPIGQIAPFDSDNGDGLTVICETTGAAVRVAAVYTQV